MPLPLATERLVLRPFRDADLPAFVAYRSAPVVARYQGWDAPYSAARATAFIEEMKRAQPGRSGQWYQVAIEVKAIGEMVGDCAFRVLPDDARQAEIGVTLACPHQGRGVATEAVSRLLDFLFGELGLHRVFAVCDVENVASARLLERVGMQREGHVVESAWFKGRWSSEYRYALLMTEWMARRGTPEP